MVQKWPMKLWWGGGLPKLRSADCASLRARGQSPELTERSRHGGSQVCILSWGGRDALMGPWNFLTSQSRLTEEPRVPMKDWLFQKPKWMIPEKQHSRWTSSLHRHMHVPAHTHTPAYTHIHIHSLHVYTPHTSTPWYSLSKKKKQKQKKFANCKFWSPPLLELEIHA